MSKELIDCSHCDGTGTCKSNNGKSCDECIANVLEKISPSDISIVSCLKCNGSGKRDINAESFHLQSMQTLENSAKNPLPHFVIGEEEKSKRILDKRRFIISLIVACSGILIILLAFYLIHQNTNSDFSTALLPIGSSMISGVLGYYISGDQYPKRNLPENKKPQ